MGDYSQIYSAIASSLSDASSIAFPGSTEYEKNMEHWAKTNEQLSACIVEPGTAADLGRVLQLITQSDVPFAIKSGGHNTNPGFSSTRGIFISMRRFTGIIYDAGAHTATIGVGEIWDNVYAALEPHGVAVAGGRVPGVGVGGLITRGGYSFFTNEVGLSIDTVAGYELVLPDGTVMYVTAESNGELFWALKGAGNNFGIVTRVTMRTFSQGFFWGGPIIIAGEHLDAVLRVFANWDANVTDPKANIQVVIMRTLAQPTVTAIMTVYCNGETPPSGIFDEALALPVISSDIKARTLIDLVKTQYFPPQKGIEFEHVPVSRFPLNALEGWINEFERLPLALENTSAHTIVTFLEHFQPAHLAHAAVLPGLSTPSAWPPTRAFSTLPNAVFALYDNLSEGPAIARAIGAVSDRIQTIAAEAGGIQTAVGAPDAVKYPNYAHWRNGPEEMYGSSLPKLRELQKTYDALGLMKRTGGFKLE